MMNTSARLLIVIAASVITLGCSLTVPTEEVYGTYVRSYPFGTETITLNRDGTFAQRVAIKQEEPVTVRGTWDFDPKESRASFYGALLVTDGFGNLRKDWRTVTTGIVSLDVERHWFKIVMASAETYPYVKQ
jgi:hypothetical protein